MAALEQASTHRNIVPLANFIGRLIGEQRKKPLGPPVSGVAAALLR